MVYSSGRRERAACVFFSSVIILHAILTGCGSSKSGTDLQNRKAALGEDDFNFGQGPGTSGNPNGNSSFVPGVPNAGSSGATSELPRISDGSGQETNPWKDAKWKKGESLADFILRVFKEQEALRRIFQEQVCGVYASLASNPTVAYVTGLYLNVLGRLPEEAGLRHWASQLPYIGDASRRHAVAEGFLKSDENFYNQVDSAYWGLLHRGPDPAGRAAWFQGMRGQTTRQIEFLLSGIGSSHEFFTRHGSNVPGFVRGLYNDLLDRDPEASGLAGWSANTNAYGRKFTVDGILGSEEFLRRLVTGWYIAYLGRAPEEPGASGWVNALVGKSLDILGAQAGILSSPEYLGKSFARQFALFKAICQAN